MMQQAALPAKIGFGDVVLLLTLIGVGGFHEVTAAILSLLMLVWLSIRLLRHGRLTVRTNLTLLTVSLLPVAYAVCSLWAVDSGMAIFGFVKFLPTVLYLLVRMQEEPDRRQWTALLPHAMTVMTVVSAIAMQIPAFLPYFSIDSRLAGFVQYPNAFALLVLLAELLLLAKPSRRWWDIAEIAVLLFGLLYSGSRTVLVLAVVANILTVLLLGGKRTKLVTAAVLGAAVLAAVAVAIFFPDSSNSFTRFLTISLSESAFVGRLLYFRDALPVILKHPFGTGYMGFYYLQQSVQTGLYAVRYVHNDFLQILLDIGWIPFLLLATVIIRALISKNAPPIKKVLLGVICAHSCFDFDLQFLAIFFLLIDCLDWQEGKLFAIVRHRVAAVTAAILLSAFTLYAGLAQLLANLGAHTAAHALYPWDTQVEIALIVSEPDAAQADAIADRILERNEHVAVAYSAKARAAYAKGDFGKVIQYKNEVFRRAPFSYDEYAEYAYMLINGIRLYEQAGDMQSAAYCRQELSLLPGQLRRTESLLSELGKQIKDQPVTTLPADVMAYIQQSEVSP